MALTVGEVARLTGVTVRTLHHYDEIGLVPASDRTDAGHRRYDRAAVERLQEVLFYRALDFSLEDIARIVSDPGYDRGEALREQHQLLSERAEHTQHLIKAVEKAMNAYERGVDLSDEDMLDVFGEEYASKHEEYEAEAEQRWGETDAWAESRRRTSQYSKEDWQRVKAEAEAVTQGLAAAMRAGAAADSEAAMDAAEAARRHIGDNFYECSHEMHAGLGDMYVADERFRKTYDDVEPGLAEYVRDAIHANARRHAEGG